MASTKFKDLAISTAAAARRKSAGRPPRDATSAIGRRMLIDITEATTIGFGELLDLPRYEPAPTRRVPDVNRGGEGRGSVPLEGRLRWSTGL